MIIIINRNVISTIIVNNTVTASMVVVVVCLHVIIGHSQIAGESSLAPVCAYTLLGGRRRHSSIQAQSLIYDINKQ